MNRRKPSLTSLVAFVMIAASGCQQPTNVSQVPDSDPFSPTNLLQDIPLGTSAEEAQRVMESKGCSCNVETIHLLTRELY